MTALDHYIQSYFGVVDQNDLQTIVALFKSSTIKKGEFLLQAGNKCDKLCFVKTGLLRIVVDKDDKEITQWISTQGYFTTDLSAFIFNTPARFSIHALVDTEIFYINKTDYDLIGTLVPQWHQLEKLFLVKCFITLEERVLSHLSMTAEERYDTFFENNKELFNQVPLQYIASMLGMTPETFSIVRKKRML